MDDQALKAIFIPIVVAAVGYVLKLIIEGVYGWSKAQEEAKARRITRLVELDSLLTTSLACFNSQLLNRERLALMIDNTNPEDAKGYEAKFAASYPAFTPDQKELHEVIRGVTMHAVRPINARLLDWVQKDDYFKRQDQRQGSYGELADKLKKLENHLILWQAKYEIWITPEKPEHALVYRGDELKHGEAFPHFIEDDVKAVLKAEHARPAISATDE